MSPPLLTVTVQGTTVVGADQLNTYEQVCPSVSYLRNFIPVTNMGVFVQGFNTAGDGGAGPFWWNSTAITANYEDDGANTIVPNGATTGVWLRLGYLQTVEPYLYVVPVTGFNVTLPTGYFALNLNPAGTLATGTVTIGPPQRDGVTVRISSSQTITSLSVGAAGGVTLLDPPTSLSANSSVTWQFVQAANAWFRS